MATFSGSQTSSREWTQRTTRKFPVSTNYGNSLCIGSEARVKIGTRNFLFTVKWYQLHSTSVQHSYFSQLLRKRKSANLNSVKRHLKPPVWKQEVLKLSYKTSEEEGVLIAFKEQRVVGLCWRKAFNGIKEVQSHQIALTGIRALRAAKQKTTVRPTQRSKIIIGLGSGRATWIFELVWWPLYKESLNWFFTMWPKYLCNHRFFWLEIMIEWLITPKCSHIFLLMYGLHATVVWMFFAKWNIVAQVRACQPGFSAASRKPIH